MRRALAAAMFAFAATAAAAPGPAPPSAAPGPSPQVVAPAGLDKQTLLGTADDITRQVSALRGLKQVRPVAKGVLSREAIGLKLRERIGKEYSAQEIRLEARILKRLGMLPEEADYEKLLIGLLEEQVAGFYDPFARQLYIADWLGLDLQRPALAHEIEHALQDQHFDLKKFSTPIKDDGDRQLARSALVEGDGTVVMFQFVVQSLGLDLQKLSDAMGTLGGQLQSAAMKSSPEFDRAPRFLRETLLFPYLAGMQFVMALSREGAPQKKGQKDPDPATAWARVDAAWKSPPESTEQVLHPKKYLTHEKPIAITVAPITALAPAKELRRDVVGELEWKLLLTAHLDDGTAERAAEGWGGDRMVAYAPPDSPDAPLAIVDLSTWDTDDDALQMESALRKWMARQVGQPEPAVDQPSLHVKDGDAWSVERRGRHLLAQFGVPKDAREKVSEEVWRSWRIAGQTP